MTCAFGIETNCLQQKENSELLQKMKAVFAFGIKETVKFMITFMSPWLAETFELGLSSNSEYLQSLVRKNMAERRKSGVKRGDFIDLLLDVLQQQEDAKEKPKHSEISTYKIVNSPQF